MLGIGAIVVSVKKNVNDVMTKKKSMEAQTCLHEKKSGNHLLPPHRKSLDVIGRVESLQVFESPGHASRSGQNTQLYGRSSSPGNLSFFLFKESYIFCIKNARLCVCFVCVCVCVFVCVR